MLHLDFVHLYVYYLIMKRRDLEKKLKKLGWYAVVASGRGPHDKWTNGQQSEAIPRHREINEILAQKILRTASIFPGKKKES